MSLKSDVEKYTSDTFKSAWTILEGQEIPEPDDNIGLGNDGVKINAVVLYADLRDSTGLVKSYKAPFAAEVYKTYIYAAAKTIRFEGGEVTAYDGDRVMGVFMGKAKRNDAARTALRINGLVRDILQPALKAQYSTSTYQIRQKIGIDSSELLVANTGIRGNNDYVWVGSSANNAAKLAALSRGYSSYITEDVFSYLKGNNLKTGSGSDVWTNLGTSDLGFRVYGSDAWIAP